MKNQGMRTLMSAVCLTVTCVALSGCMSVGGAGSGDADGARATATNAALAQIQAQELNGEASQIVNTLLDRRSVIPNNSAFATVAQSVLSSNARTADADLRAARLRAQAKSKNWLPSIGPIISLTSLGNVVAQLLVEQVLFDNGRAKAERQFAAHDVEAAAVSLSQDSNDRVATALKLYIASQRAREQAAVARRAQAKMGDLVNIIERRVNGGVSNLADLSVGRSKLQELDAEYARAQEAEATALAELEAMARVSLASVDGITQMGAETGGKLPLNVMKAQAEGERTIAQAKMNRADLLPGISASGTVGEGGVDIGVNVAGDQLINLGTGAALKAIEAGQDSARRGVAQAEEDNQRIVRRLEQKRIALQRQQAESASLVAEARQNYDLFFNQFQNSGRPIMDVVNIYENAMRLERDSVRLRFELAEIQVEIASLYGTLVSGGDV